MSAEARAAYSELQKRLKHSADSILADARAATTTVLERLRRALGG